jgi:hypothetical protein
MDTAADNEALLAALGEQLHAADRPLEVVVIGSALTALEPLPGVFRSARAAVARDFGLDENWLTAGATQLLPGGLPPGFRTRAVSRQYGPGLTVHSAGRPDQIHLALFALADQGGARHEAALRALNPEPAELFAAARWAMTQDPAPEFRDVLFEALQYLGVDEA